MCCDPARNMTKKIGIIAGQGRFPHMFATAARKDGCEVVIVAHKGQSLPDLVEHADRLFWVKLGQLGKIIKIFQEQGVAEVAFLGAITKTNMFRDVLPDLRGLSLWNRIKKKHDDGILRAVADELEREGIRVVESTRYLGELFFPKGILSRKRPSPEQMDDVRFGWQMAKAIGRLDIGQCVVVRDRAVVAVEAMEGTNATIKRGGALAREKAVVVKVKKPQQDVRFDLPAIGVETIAAMQEVRAAVLAVEAGQSLLFDQESTIRRADEAGIVLMGLEETQSGEPRYDL